MQIRRYFTTDGQSPYHDIAFKTISCKGARGIGETLATVHAPEHWSQTACEILSQTYFRRADVPSETQPVIEADVPGWLSRREPTPNAVMGTETDARAVFDRMAGCWSYWGWKGGYFNTGSDARAFYDEIRYMLAMQMAAPDGPQWLNTGLHWAYGITEEPQGHFYVDYRSGKAHRGGSAYERPYIQGGEPRLDGGILSARHYPDTINAWNTCPKDGQITAANPGSASMFLDNTACNLASLNLIKFIDSDGVFDAERFAHSCRLWTVVLEISVMMAQLPSDTRAQRSYAYRSLGLGYNNLGGLLTSCDIPYDSDRARAVAAVIAAQMSGVAYAASAEMAKFLGTFPRFKANKIPMLRVMNNHALAARGETDSRAYKGLTAAPIALNQDDLPNAFKAVETAANTAWNTVLSQGKKHGFRNAQISTTAPTSIIDLIMDCEPASTENLFPRAQLLMAAAVQPFISGAVLTAIVMPKTASATQLEDIYATAQGLGLKAVAIYPEGSKSSQPTSSTSLKDDRIDDDRIEAMQHGGGS